MVTRKLVQLGELDVVHPVVGLQLQRPLKRLGALADVLFVRGEHFLRFAGLDAVLRLRPDGSRLVRYAQILEHKEVLALQAPALFRSRGPQLEVI